MGGEITWECLKTGPNAGSYVFTLKVYRDCAGITVSTFAQTINVWGHPTVSTITANFISQQDVSPLCDPINSGNQQYSCANGDLGAVEEYVFETPPTQLSGIPPADGWHFTWNNCCRNAAIVNMASSQEGFTLRASMYPTTIQLQEFQYLLIHVLIHLQTSKSSQKQYYALDFPFHITTTPQTQNLII